MVREILKIYTDNGLGSNNPKFKDIEISEYQYKSSRMGMPELTATLMWGTCLDEEWTGKEYVVLNEERFYIRHTPSSSKSNTDARYKHDISFTSEVAEILGNTYYEDAVPSYSATYDKPCTNSTKFTFYGTIHEFCARLNCGFIKAGIGDTILDTKTSLTPTDEPIGDGYCVIVDEAGIADPDKTYNFEWEDKYLWEAITEGYNITEIPFERRGKEIIFGAVPVVVEHKFKYGHDNELLSVSKNNANAKVVNRITMFGSSENIPYYYPNETEYGHISIKAKSGNNVLAANMVSIENMTQMLSRLNADSYAVLGKYDGIDVGNAEVNAYMYSCAFGSGQFYNYTLGRIEKHNPDESHNTIIPWHVRAFFEVTEAGVVECFDICGKVWMTNTSSPTTSENMIDAITVEKLATVEDLSQGITSVDYTSQIDKQEGKISLGYLAKGKYYFQFSVKIQNRGAGRGEPVTSFCSVDSIGIEPASKQKMGYYWKVGDKEYDGVGALGVKLSTAITDDMIGDGFGWEASGRMPFQTNLAPPKFRSTLGAERFYNALNNTYTDPDTNSKYTFPNPYIAGAPSEYIYKNEEIKPTIEGVKNASNQLMGVIADIAYDADDNDSLKAESSEDKDKNDSLKYEHSFFYIKLNIFNGNYGFDLFKHASQTDAMTIQMRDGSCNGCKFKIQAVKFTDDTGLETYKNPIIIRNGAPVGVVSEEGIKESDLDPSQQNTQTNSIWICVQKDAETFGVIMPNKSHSFKPKVGDKFNIINIDLPQAYILFAEKRLEEEGIRFMADNNEEKFTFDISASRIFFADNPDTLAELDEYSKIKVEYNDKTYEQYINQLSIDCKDNEALPNIGIDLTDTLSVGQSFLDSVAERASSLIANATTMGGNIGGGGGMSVTVADRRYINKQKSDRTPYKVASDTAFEVGEFVSGGSGAILMRDPVTGQTYLEVDKIKARMKAIFAELEIAKESSIGGAFDITPGGGIDITFVEDIADTTDEEGNTIEGCYRCYFKAKDEDKGADCRFVVGDQARCNESNISNGTTQNASNRYYWRLVTAVNNNESYIELSKTDCDTGSDAPMPGDTIVQLGNRNDAERQSAIVLSTIDASAPSVTLYNGIDHYSLDGKAVVEYGVDKSKNPPEPFFNCYGRFYFGPKGGNSYLKFEPSVGKLIFSGELINISHLNGKELDQYIKDVVPPVTQEDIEGYVNAIVDPQIENIQNQIDGVIETWFYNGVPTLSNYPASEWNTDALKIAHLGDLYYDNDTGTAYRFSQDNNGNYYWNTITDDAITKALAAAKEAQDTADGKRRVFVSQPTPPYQQGDLWVNATYAPDYNNDILRCITNDKKDGGTFSIADWTLASKYTDDSALNTFIAQYTPEIEGIKTQIDGKAQTWYQPTDPSADWETKDYLEHKGDLWYNTTNGTTWYWDGTQWKQQDVPDAVFDKIDGKADIFVSKPTGGYHQNDLWFLEADYTLSDGAHKAGTLAVALHDMGASFNFNDWAKKDRYTDDTKANQAIEEIGGYQYLKQAIANGASLFQGGLILSGLIKLGEWDLTDRNNPVQTEVWAGMNGIYNHPKTIASFWGGDMVDKFYNDSVTPRPTPLASGYAQALIRMDGTGYLAGGNIKWDSDGSGSVAGGNISWNALGSLTLGNGIKIDLGSGNETTLGGIQASLESITNLLAKFSDNFVPMVRLADGNVVETNWGNINNNNPLYAVKSVKGFYSEEFISARGKNDNGSQGGATQLRMLEDVNINDNALASGQSLVYDGSKWVNMKAGLNTTELASYLTTNNYAKKSDIPPLTDYATKQWVEGKGYLVSSDLTDYAKKSWVNQQGFLTSVAFSDLTSHPDKLADYGITDAKISNGTITLGTNTITPLVSADLKSLTFSIGAFTASKTYTPTTAQTVNIPKTTDHISEGSNQYFTPARAQNALASTVTALNNAIALKLDASVFEELFEKVNIGTASAPVYAIKAKLGLYTDQFLSARGMNSNGGGGGNFGLLHSWPSTAPSQGSTDAIDAYLAWGLKTDIAGLQSQIDNLPTTSVNPHALTIKRNNSSLGSYDGSEAKTFNISVPTKVSDLTNDSGYLNAITKAQVEGVLTGNISSHTHSYLPLSGGVLKNGTNPVLLSIDTDSTSEVGMRFCVSGTVKGWLGYHSTYGTNLYNYAKGWYLGLKDDGTLYYSGGTIWHSGNDGSGSGLDADLLDGMHTDNYIFYKTNTVIPSLTTFNGYRYLKIVIGGWGKTNTVFRIICNGDNSQSDILLIVGARDLDWSGFQSKYNFVALTGIAKVINGADIEVYLRLSSLTTRVSVRANKEISSISTDDYSSQNYITTKGGLFGSCFNGNADTATKLQTSRTIWGQSFDGTGNVGGDLSGCTRISNANSANLYIGNSNNSGWVLTQDICSHSGAGDGYWSLRTDGTAHFRSLVMGGNINLGGGHSIIGKDSVEIFKDHGNGNVTVNGAKGDLYLGYGYTDKVYFFSGNTGGTGTQKAVLLANGNFGIGVDSPTYKLDVNGSIKGASLLTTGDITAGSTIISGDCFDRTGYVGTSWHAGKGAYNVAITNNTAQTPLMLAYRAGQTPAATGANRLFALELLNNGELLRFCFGGSYKFHMDKGGTFYAEGDISASGNIGGNNITAQSLKIGDCEITWENGGLHFSKGIYSDSFVSARGANSSAGSGSVGVDADEVNNLISTYLTNYQYAKQSWVEGKGYLTAITKAQVEGVLTGNISSHTHSYLPLSGGVLKNGTNPVLLSIDTDSTSEVGMRFCVSGTVKGWLGYHSTYGTNLFNYAKGWYLGLKDDGNLYYSGGTIWHSGNDGSGSGLDADLLDGVHASSFVDRRVGNGDDNLAILKALHPSLADSDAHTVRLQHGEHSMAFGWFLKGYALANAYGGWFVSDYGTPRWIGADNGNWKSETFAFLSSNVASATRLQGTYSLWGQSFYGNNVSGNMTGVGDITTTSANGRFIKCNGASHEWGLHMGSGGEDRGIYEWTTGYDKWLIYFNNSNTILNHGNVGIGTTSPTYKLEVNGSIKGASLLTTGDITMNGNLINTYRGNGMYSKFVVEFGTMAINVEAPLSVNDISSDPIPVNFGWRGGSYALTLASNKNVGIGTANPDYKLDVNGDIRSNGWLRTTGDAGWYSQTYGGGWRMTDTTWIRTYGGKSIYHDSGILRTDGILQVGNGGERFIVTDTGAVGIGTNNPAYKLHVNGVAYASTGIFSDGYVSARGQNTSSDIRLKTNLTPFELALHQIANAPSVNFDWLEGSHDVGSIAQYWESVNPILTPKDPDGYLTLQYGKTALLSVITVAKETERLIVKADNHEERISRLEQSNRDLKRDNKALRQENKELKNKIFELERR